MPSPIGLESDFFDPITFAYLGEIFLDNSENVFTFGSVEKPLNELLLKSMAPKIMELLSLDVEGPKIEVLKGIDYKNFKFKYMCIESRDIAKLNDYLTPLGYHLLEKLSSNDYLFTNEI